MTVRSMTPEEEVNLATIVSAREIYGLPGAIYLAEQAKLPGDLIDLVRAGLTFEEVDLFLEGEGEEGDCRYVWSLPTEGGTH